jgi:hypothetical protein
MVNKSFRTCSNRLTLARVAKITLAFFDVDQLACLIAVAALKRPCHEAPSFSRAVCAGRESEIGTNLTLCSVVFFAASSQGSLGRF